jgi:hypothetical protein
MAWPCFGPPERLIRRRRPGSELGDRSAKVRLVLRGRYYVTRSIYLGRRAVKPAGIATQSLSDYIGAYALLGGRFMRRARQHATQALRDERA